MIYILNLPKQEVRTLFAGKDTSKSAMTQWDEGRDKQRVLGKERDWTSK